MRLETHRPGKKARVQHEYAILLVLLMGMGLWLRIRHLGDLSLVVDEGVQALAVEAILQHGIPTMDSGLLYLRGPLYLYTQAALAYVSDLNEFWLRLPSVLWGIAAIIPTYILGKFLFNRPVGALSAAVIAFSVWEIEMSRYARVYIAFQFFFLVSLICFYRGFMRGKQRFKIWFLVVAFLTFLTHELSQVVGTLFLIPLFSSVRSWKQKVQVGYWAVGLGALLLVARRLNGLRLPAGSASSPEGGSPAVGVIDQITRALGIPSVNGPDMSHFVHAVQQHAAVVGALTFVVGLTTAYLCYRFFRKRRGGPVILGLLMLWAALTYQFGLVLIFFVVYLALYARDLRRFFRDRILLSAVVASVVCFVGWFALLATSSDLLLVEVPMTLFGFPAFYKYLLRWLVKGWPVVTVLLAIGSVWLFVRFVNDRRDTASLFLLGALYVPALFASLFQSAYVPVYTLHLYPLVVLIFAMVVWSAGVRAWAYFRSRTVFSTPLAVLLAIPFVLLISQDANPMSAWRVGERTYRSEKPSIRNVMTFRFYSDFHQDIKGPAKFVGKQRNRRDIIAVIGPGFSIPIFQYYIGNVDYALTSRGKANELGLIKNGRNIHYITSCEFVTGVSELEELIQNQRGRLWIVGDRRTLLENNPYHTDERVKEVIRRLTEHPDYVGRDGITFALKVR